VIWLTLLTILLILLVLTALISALVLYLPFCNSSEKRWRDQVLALLAASQRREWTEQNELRQLGIAQSDKASSLRDEAFHSCLAEISVSELEAYPGIGPATIDKLRSAGYTTLAALRRTHYGVHGLGEKRWSDIHSAVNDLTDRAQGRFESGICRQTHELAGKLQSLAVQYGCLEARTLARLQAAQQVTTCLKEPAIAARQVTFLRWFRPLSEEPIVPTQMMAAALPDLERTVRSADARAQQAWEARSRTPPAARLQALEVSPSNARPASQVAARGDIKFIDYTQVRDGARSVPPVATPVVRTDGLKALVQPSSSITHQEVTMPDENHLLLMELTIQFALGVARAEGPVTPGKRELIQEHVAKRFGYNRALLNRAEAFCAHYESAAIDLEACLRQIKERFTGEHRAALIRFAAQIAAVSPTGKAKAVPFLQELAQRLGVRLVYPAPPSDGQTAASKDEWLKLLQIAPNLPLTPELIRRQWTLLSQRLEPDKVVALGPKFVKMAEDELAALRLAAERLLAQLGQKLETKSPTPVAPNLRHNPDLDDVFGGM